VTLGNGRTINALTYDGQAPGPELRIRQGELIEVTLKNKDIENGVTIHWHGVNVPNAEDGVAGVTQDAVLPGETYVYRFRAPDVGTYWYHSHQLSLEQVVGGLVGPLIVEPPEGLPSGVVDLTVALHAWREDANPTFPGPGPPQFDFSTIGTTSHARRTVTVNTEVRLRVINTDPIPRELTLTGTTFKVAAIDGVELYEPGDLDHARLLIAAGGRYDLRFTMPNGPVIFRSIPDFGEFLNATLLLSPDGTGELRAEQTTNNFDPIGYGRSRPEDPLPAHFDREHVFKIDTGVGFLDGQLGLRWLVNGRKMPDMPHVTVREGQWVKITFINRTFDYHPLHPHGHRMRVLSKNGRLSSGSPWYTDTLNVAPGETIEVAFKADNPGVWMDHCHNLIHATEGFVMHLLYENVMTPFRVGRETRNKPD
jgi:FtsP/CotA-like multicopper oxidase with cupredoxin domain